MKTTLIIQKNALLIRLTHRLDGGPKSIEASKLANSANNIYQNFKLMDKNKTLAQIKALFEVF